MLCCSKKCFVAVVAVLIFGTLYVITTVDLNLHELQYVADHLTPEECRKLEAALHQRTFQLNFNDPALVRKPKKGTAKTPCIIRLLKWDRGIGSKNTFHDLAIRLKELGFEEMSDKLSRTVYNEKAMAIEKNFVKDPFKKLIPTKSGVLDEPKERKSKQIEPMKEEIEDNSTKSAVWITVGVISVFVVIFVAFYVCCPAVLVLLWEKAAPEGCIVGCELMCDEYSICCKRFGKHYQKHLLGRRNSKRNAGPPSIPEGLNFDFDNHPLLKQ